MGSGSSKTSPPVSISPTGSNFFFADFYWTGDFHLLGLRVILSGIANLSSGGPPPTTASFLFSSSAIRSACCSMRLLNYFSVCLAWSLITLYLLRWSFSRAINLSSKSSILKYQAFLLRESNLISHWFIVGCNFLIESCDFTFQCFDFVHCFYLRSSLPSFSEVMVVASLIPLVSISTRIISILSIAFLWFSYTC